VDEQCLGPFTMWHHQHHFKSIEGAVDTYVHYKLSALVFGRSGKLVICKKQTKKNILITDTLK